jgi:hypothetical protein
LSIDDLDLAGTLDELASTNPHLRGWSLVDWSFVDTPE